MKTALIESSAKFPQYSGTIEKIQEANVSYFPYLEARSLFIELVYYGPDILLHSLEFSKIIESYDELADSGELDAAIQHALAANEEYARNYDASVDEKLFSVLVEGYLDYVPEGLEPQDLLNAYNSHSSADSYARSFYAKSLFDNPKEVERILNGGKSKQIKKLANDPAYKLIKELRANYFDLVAPGYYDGADVISSLTADYTRGLRQMFPEENFPVDANSTLTYLWKIEVSPHDGMTYAFQQPRVFCRSTSLVIQISIYLRTIDALREGDWGRYGTGGEDNELSFSLGSTTLQAVTLVVRQSMAMEN